MYAKETFFTFFCGWLIGYYHLATMKILLRQHSLPYCVHFCFLVTYCLVNSKYIDIFQVKSISYKALSASVHEIGSVCSMIDRIARTAGCNESGAAISLDLVANNRYQSQLRSTSGSPPSEKMNRHLTALTCDHISEIESTKNSRIKRCRIEVYFDSCIVFHSPY